MFLLSKNVQSFKAKYQVFFSISIFLLFTFVKCSTNSTNYEQKVDIICPTGRTLCPDLDCVLSKDSCNALVPTCPPHKPYKCWNNECRTSFSQCPSKITCPADAPLLCYTGMCVKSASECEVRKDTGDCTKDKALYRCYDGNCVKNIELCPTYPSCGSGIKCWNGACVESIDDCLPLVKKCSGTMSYLCPDGSCRPNKKSCPTISTCPPSTPVKCFDNSCRASIEECPLFQSCGDYKKSCPDGSCATSFEKCPSMITCFSDKPFLCYDGSCKKDVTECHEPPKCTNNEVLCPNGACASYRQNCKVTEPCSKENPIKCEMNTCTDNYEECSSSTVSKRCPIGFVACPDGQCKISEYLCEPFKCPENLPYKCAEGVCAFSKDYCDNTETGCPYNAQIRCLNGTCVNNTSLCTEYICESTSHKLCPDGSCILEAEECPKINGCYKDRPFKCADGTCINPETTTCSPVLCPHTLPIKCPNGLCVRSQSDCTANLKPDDRVDCEEEGYIMCVDGRCVPSSDLCRPAFECEPGYYKCSDGTCRVAISLCPKDVACPPSRPYRCSDQICAKDESNCVAGFTCQEGYKRCSDDGLCTIPGGGCPQSKKRSGCAINDLVRCSSGRCLDSEELCKSESIACPDDENPILCSNGKCASSSNMCGSGSCDGYKCPTGRCVPNDNKSKRTLCTNEIGCPLHRPYRCFNGECAFSYKDCKSTGIKGGYLTSNVACDVSKPFLCSDMSCVSSPEYCKTHVDCEPGSYTKCDNGYCVKNLKECAEKFDNYCPLAAPIQCPSGSCARKVDECSTAGKVESCVDGEFYCTRLAKCVKKKLDCLMFYDDYSEQKNTRRLFENFANPLDDDNSLHKNNFVSFYEENDENKKEKEGKICYDGTIAKDDEKCPVVPSCRLGQYRCENGGCAYDIKDCEVENDLTCSEGQIKCPDGLCHDKEKNCADVNYHGCLVGQYQCTNGLCVENEFECIGYSMCSDPAVPFRCITGVCKTSPAECPTINRLSIVKPLTYSFDKFNKISFSFAFDQNGKIAASIEIPGNGFQEAKEEYSQYSQVMVSEVSSSILYDTKLYNHSAEFLYNVSNSIKGSEGVLNFENSVLSPVFKFYTKDKSLKFKMNGLMTVIHNIYDVNGLNPSDYCLAELKGYDLEKDEINYKQEGVGWTCTEAGRKVSDEQTGFIINKFGVFAVILNPLRQKRNYLGDSEEKNFFLENVKSILIVFICIVLLLLLISYIFSRVGRYREKYHENRNKILLMQQQKQEYENMTTDIFGQTLGDNINGIVYKANPVYSATKEIKHKDTSLEEEIENLQIQCKNVNDQNTRLQGDIDELTEKYKLLSAQIDKMAAQG